MTFDDMCKFFVEIIYHLKANLNVTGYYNSNVMVKEPLLPGTDIHINLDLTFYNNQFFFKSNLLTNV